MNRTPSLTRRVFLAGVGLAMVATPLATAHAAKDSVVIAWPADPQTWDPDRRTNPGLQSLYKMVFSQPMTQTPDQKIVPGVLKSAKLSPDGKSVTVVLRNNVYWQDGRKMTTEDIKYTFYGRMKAGQKIDLARVWRNVTGVEIKSPTVAVIKLSKPMPTAIPWMAFLANFIVPKHYMEKVGVQGFSTKPIGSGPYKLVDYQRNSRIVLEAWDKYWGPKPKIKKVTIQIIKDPSARVAAVQSGRVDFAPDVPVREAQRLNKIKGLTGVIYPVSKVILLQIRSDGAFKNKNVRLAAHYAINKMALSKAFYAGVAVPLSVVAPPGTPGYIKGFKIPYNPKKARALLAKAGYGPKHPVKIGFATYNGVFPSDYDMARAIAAMWKKVGIDAKVEVIEQAKYFELNRGNKLPEATLYNWDNATGDPEMFTGYLLNPKLPFSAWKDMDVGGRVMKLFGIVNYDKRIAAYKKVEKYATEQGATIPLLQAVTTMVYKSNLNVVRYDNGWVLPQFWSWK
jgi:peptide/nickel transport system substrate-binding protein